MTLKHAIAAVMVSALPGYMVHLSETCDSDGCHLITNVMTTTAAVHEAKCTQDIHQSLVNKQLAPDEHESRFGICQLNH
jgi:hypothetical protein